MKRPDKKTLLKSVIGTFVIYLILFVFSIIYNECIIPYHGTGLGTLSNIPYAIFYLLVCLPALGIAGGLLFKGKIYVWIWAVGAVLFVIVSGLSESAVAPDILANIPIFAIPLLISFLTAKGIILFISPSGKVKTDN